MKTKKHALLEFADLLKVPFLDGGRDERGMDCRGMTIAALERMGFRVPESALPARDRAEADCVDEIMCGMERDGLFDPGVLWARWWTPVSEREARRGDVAFYVNPEHAHVAPVVARHRGTPPVVITTSPSRGARLSIATRLAGLMGYYRLKESNR